MGCLFPCFSTSKHKKRLQSANISPTKDQKDEVCEALEHAESIKQDTSKNPINDITDSKEKLEEQLSCDKKKKAAFDPNVTCKEVVHDLVETSLEERETVEREDPEAEYASSKVSLSYTPNHRYNNCTNSDDEFVDTETEEGDSAIEDGEDHVLVQEESSESLFSLSIDSRKQVSTAEMGEKEVNSPMPVESNPNARDKSQYVHSVLNPVENLTQWKSVKAKGTPPLKRQAKENINLDEECKIPFCSEPVKLSTRKLKPVLNQNQEMAVETSLSSWLVESEPTPMSKTGSISVGNSGSGKAANSWTSNEDKSILGALTIEDIKMCSATSSPKRSPSRSPDPDDIPIIGTIGSYWRQTGHTMDSISDSGSSLKSLQIATGKYKEDKKVNLQGTPFDTRLERALDR